MPDWEQYLRQNLPRLSRGSAHAEDVISELAVHLEESYTALLANGIPKEEALSRSYTEVKNWARLEKEILAAKEDEQMENRVTQLWVPGVVALVASAGFLIALQLAGFGPRMVPIHVVKQSAISLHVYWLIGLPAIGALSALFAKHAKANRMATRIACLFPALVMSVALFLVFLGAFFLDRPILAQMETIGFWAAALNWVILPSVSLLLGAWVFQQIAESRASSG